MALLQKVIGTLVMPVGLLWMIWLAYVVWLAWRGANKRAALVFGFLWVVFTLMGNGMVAGSLFSWLERDYYAIRPFEEKPFEAIFVLGGATGTDPHGTPFVTGAGDRVVLAARLYLRKQTRYLVASGSRIPGLRVRANKARETSLIWQSLGVPKQSIIELAEPYNTRLEVRAYQALARKRGWKRVGVISSAWHLRRVMKTCQKLDFRAQPLPADFRGGAYYDGILSLLPTGYGLSGVQRAAWEILGALVKT
jgi:uncharacterized SAM-binding protein YcdF (DUF218 family)